MQQEKAKRKNYEIRVLKGELATRDRDLSDTKRKLMTLETNLVSNLFFTDMVCEHGF